MIKDKRYAIVTGGTKGIGLGIVKKLFSKGYFVAALGRNLSDELKDVIDFSSEKVKFIKCDIGDIDSIDYALKEVVENFGYIDLLVNNAGVAPSQRLDILNTNVENFDGVININLKGTFFMTQKVSKIMIEQKRKNNKIINISSISSYTSSTNRGEYCISKAGISMITSLFADRLACENILVYEIRPGIIKTDMTNGVSEKYETEIKNGLLPISRWGLPEDIGNMVYALSREEFSYSTGDVINVDGGFHIRRL